MRSCSATIGGVAGNVISGNDRNGIEVRDTASGFTSFNTFAGIFAFAGAAERLYEKARSLGAGRAPAQTLLLSECLFGLPLPAGLRKELERDRVNAMLARITMRELQQEHTPAERRLGTLPLHLIRPLLVSGWRSKLSEIKRQLQDVVQHATLPA